MRFHLCTAVVCWLALASGVHGQLVDVKVTGPTRLDWEFAAKGFRGDPPSDVPADYDSKKQRYQLYVPFQYAPTKAWPLIVFISPGPGPVGWDRFQRICQNEGMLFCSPYKAGNSTPPGLRTRVILDMVDDVRRNYRIDPNQTYIGGFSGGGRMSCSIGFALPEVFAGVMPVCGTNPVGTLAYVRHRLVDRISVAFVTGQKDFNRDENEVWMAPYLKELEIRTKLWVVPGMGHDIPRDNVMEEVVAWLAADRARRQEDAQTRPRLNLKSDEAFRDEAQADRLLAAARDELRDKQRLWHGVAILDGIRQRWPEFAASHTAEELRTKTYADQDLVEPLRSQYQEDIRKSYSAQARGFERSGKNAKAIEVWEALARGFPDSSVAEKAREEIRRLQEQPPPVQPEKKKRKAKK